MRDDFAVFILSHGRADRVYTVDTLAKCGYTGLIYIIVDTDDSQLDDYVRNFGEECVIPFDKEYASQFVDTYDLNPAKNIVVYARNMCHKIARELGLTYFLELDDDYGEFRCRKEFDDKFGTIYVRDFDSIVNCMIEFLDTSGAHTVAFAQTGDFIGGKGSNVWRKQLCRKAMNSFFCRTDMPFDFLGRINEDTTAYVTHGSRGKLFFTIRDVSLDQIQTQANAGGLTDSYLDLGTYIKSFYSVMSSPSSVKVHCMGVTHKRFHHLIDWEATTPKIISGKYKRGEL